MSAATKRWAMGYAVYLIGGAAAYGIAAYTHQLTYPVVAIFILGYLVGRISKTIER